MVNTVFIVCCVAGHKMPIVVLSYKEIIQCCLLCYRSVQNADCRPGTKCRLDTKCRLQLGRLQAEYKMQTDKNNNFFLRQKRVNIPFYNLPTVPTGSFHWKVKCCEWSLCGSIVEGWVNMSYLIRVFCQRLIRLKTFLFKKKKRTEVDTINCSPMRKPFIEYSRP